MLVNAIASDKPLKLKSDFVKVLGSVGATSSDLYDRLQSELFPHTKALPQRLNFSTLKLAYHRLVLGTMLCHAVLTLVTTY